MPVKGIEKSGTCPAGQTLPTGRSAMEKWTQTAFLTPESQSEAVMRSTGHVRARDASRIVRQECSAKLADNAKCRHQGDCKENMRHRRLLYPLRHALPWLPELNPSLSITCRHARQKIQPYPIGKARTRTSTRGSRVTHPRFLYLGSRQVGKNITFTDSKRLAGSYLGVNLGYLAMFK